MDLAQVLRVRTSATRPSLCRYPTDISPHRIAPYRLEERCGRDSLGRCVIRNGSVCTSVRVGTHTQHRVQAQHGAAQHRVRAQHGAVHHGTEHCTTRDGWNSGVWSGVMGDGSVASLAGTTRDGWHSGVCQWDSGCGSATWKVSTTRDGWHSGVWNCALGHGSAAQVASTTRLGWYSGV